MLRLRFAILSLLCVVSATPLVAEDWPNWMGPDRDNRWNESGIIKAFPEGGPSQLWSADVAGGYAGPAVVGDRLYLMDYVTEANVKVSNFDRKEFEGTERVLCLDANTGQQIWKHEYPLAITVSYPAGPRCTPVVEGDFVYTLGAEGNLICFERTKGEIIWERDLRKDYKTLSALWGYANHPLIDGDKLICVVGGKGSHTVAFDKTNGKELWKYGEASEQGYSPPTIIEQAGVKQLILCSPDWVASVNPDSGEEYWAQEYGASSGSIIMTPIKYENYLFVGGYSKRNLMMELSQDKPAAKKLFRDKTKLGISPVNVQPFLDGNLMIGIDQGGELMAVEIPSGKRLWTSPGPFGDRPVGSGTAFIVKNDGLFYLFCETGEMVIAKIDAEGYEEVDRAMLIEPTNNAFGRPVAWYPPAFAGGKVYLRNDEKCICVDLTQ